MAEHLNFESCVPKNCEQDMKHALMPYIISYQNGASSFEMLKECITQWILTNQISSRKVTTSPSSSLTTSETGATSKISKSDGNLNVISYKFNQFTVCTYCRNFLSDPITVSCGHTYCKKCIRKKGILLSCKKCATSLNGSELNSYKTNVVIANLLKKWWPRQVLSVQLKDEADELFQKGELEGALKKYEEAVQSGNPSHILESNYSLALLNSGKSLQALQHAETCVKICPDWPKGYYRKAAALLSLGRIEDAAVAYVHCLLLEPNWSSVTVELTKVLQKMISGRLPGKVRQEVALLSSSSFNEADCEERPCKIQHLDAFYAPNRSENITNSKELGKFYRFLDRCQHEVEQMKTVDVLLSIPYVDAKLLSSADFECTLCLRIFWQPVTTPCGHVFCRTCLDRCLDHAPRCPLCKTSLADYLAQRRHFITEFIEMAMKQYIPEAYAERKLVHDDEIKELTSNENSDQRELPIFICTLAFPTLACPLHVFEPRYRLMIRRCMESGGRKFGMCTTEIGSGETFADHGTILEIRGVNYFPDGRALVDTVGRERFRILQKSLKDGYHTAVVEILRDWKDTNIETTRLHDTVYHEVKQWLETLRQPVRDKIFQHFGALPEVESNYNELPNGPSWVWWALAILPLDPRAQLLVLSMTSLQNRLKALHNTLNYIQQNPR